MKKEHCHFVNDPEVGKVLVPMCMGTAANMEGSSDEEALGMCTCYIPRTVEQELHEFRRQVEGVKADADRVLGEIRERLKELKMEKSTPGGAR